MRLRFVNNIQIDIYIWLLILNYRYYIKKCVSYILPYDRSIWMSRQDKCWVYVHFIINIITSKSGSLSILAMLCTTQAAAICKQAVSGSALMVYKRSVDLCFNWPIDLSTELRVDFCNLLKFLSCAVPGLRYYVIRYGSNAYPQPPSMMPSGSRDKFSDIFLV